MKWLHIFKETFFISSIHLSTKILGFLEKILIAYIFGASSVSDAYFFSFAVFIIIFDFFNESISPALLPEYVKSETPENRKKLFSSAFTWLISIGLSLSLLLFLSAPWLIRTFSDFPEQTAGITVLYLRMISIGLGFVIASISTYLFINSGQKFLPASLGDLMFKLTGSILILYVLFNKKAGLISLAAGIALGSVMKLTTHLIYLGKKSLRVSFRFNSSLKKVIALSSPMVIGILFSKSRILFDNFIVSGMAVGSVTALQYGYRVMEFGIVVILEPFSTVIYPEFVRLVNDREQFAERISSGLKLLLTLFLPISVITFTFRTEIITILFGRGEFDQSDILITAAAFSFYALSMALICIDLLLSRSLFSMGDTKFPALFEILSIGFHIGFVMMFKSSGIHIISLAFFLNRIIKSVLLYLRLKLSSKIHLKSGSFFIKIFIFLVLDSVIVKLLITHSGIQNLGVLTTFTSLSLLFIALYVIQLYLSGILSRFSVLFKK